MKEPKKAKAPSTSQPQIEKFRKAARELETDQSDEAFESALGKIAHAPKLTNEQVKNLIQKNHDKSTD